MKKILLLLSSLFVLNLASAQVTTIDFETAGDGYTPSATAGSGFIDVFNRANPNIGGNSSFMWAVEDISLTNPSITLDQIDITGSTDFTFAIDMLAHHYNDWDGTDQMRIYYSIDGGTDQNLLWVESVGTGFNTPAALDTDFNGVGNCGAANTLPSLTTGTSGSCTVSANTFATFTTAAISLSSNTTLDITIEFTGLTANDEGIYLDNIVITETGGSTPTISVAPSAITGLDYVFASGPSAGQSYAVSGTNLTPAAGNITVTAPTNFSVSTTLGGTYTSSLTLAYTGGALAATDVFVRLNAGLGIATYGPVNVNNTGGGAPAVTTAVTGEVTPSPPPNDLCGGATSLTVNTTCTNVSSTNVNASNSGELPAPLCASYSGEDVWFAITVPANGEITVETSANGGFTDGGLALYSGTCGSLSLISCNDDGGTGSFELINATGLTPASTVYARVWEFGGGTTGTFNICVTSPAPLLPCVTPTNQATALAFSNVTGSSLDVAYTAASPAVDNYLVVRSTSATLSSNPVDASTYAVSSSLGSGTVVFNGSGTSFTDTGLSPTTTYYYFVFAYNDLACSGGPVYLTPALTGNETTLTIPTCNELMISEYHEAASGNEKFIEIYNPTAGAINLASYRLATYTNGSSTVSAFISLSGSLPAFSTYVVGNSGAALYAPDLSNGGTVMQFNGNDVIALQTSGGTNIDVVGVIGSSSNFAANVRLIRNSTVQSTTTTYNAAEWTSTAANNVSDLGMHTSTCAVSLPEIEIQGNATEIVAGDITPDVSDHTDFETTAVIGGTVVRTFTIFNTGSADLTVTGVSSSNAAIFAVGGIATPITVLPASSTTFTVTFDPAVLGSITETITVANDDADEASYQFDITGEGVNSNTSDIIESAGFTYTSNIDYTTFQAAGPLTNATGNVGVFRFEVRDGGGVADADALGTELTGITFDLGSTHAAYIRSAALFDGLSMRANAPTINVGAGTITFSGLSGANFTAADNGSLTLTLRVSFLTNVVDNEQLQFTISNATANTSTSVFAASDAGGAVSSIVGDRNRLEVTATALSYATNASDALINIAMGVVEVEGVDLNGNRDLDWTDNVSITSTGTMTGSPITVAAVSGLATFSSIVHTVAGTGFTLDAAHSSFTSITSALFDVTDLPLANGDYRTTGSGDWNNNSASPAIWERFNGTSWAASNSPSFNTTNRMYIRSGHTITTNGSWGSGARLYILDGGTFINEHNGTANEVFVYENGLLDIREFFRVGTGSGTLEVFDGGIIYFDDEGNANLSTSLWNGTETFHPLSELHVLDIEETEYLYDGDVTTHTYSGYTAAFGIVYVDFANSTIGSTPATAWESVVGVGADGNNITHGNFEFVSTRGNTRFRFANGVDVTTGIGGDLMIQSGIGSSRRVELATGNADLVLNIEGNLEMDSPGDLYIRGGNSAAGSATINVKGDMLMNGPNVTANSEIRMNGTNYGTANGGMNIVNLEGDLLVSDGFLHNWAARDDVEFNFVGTSLQTVNVETVVSDNGARGLPMYVRNGASVILAENDLQLDNNSFLNVQDGGTFNFGFDTDNITALLVTQPGSSSGTNEFDLDQGGRLYITSPDGITNTASVGNVQVSVSNRTYNQTAYFHYIGRADQVTGNALTSGSTGKHVYVQLIDDLTTLTPSNDIGISIGATLGTPGRLHIDTGRVLGSGAADFQGTGLLLMTGGWYVEDVLTSHNIAPQLEGSYTLTAGTIELNSAGDQTLRGTRDYFNLMISGSNVSGTNDKTPTSAFTVDNKLTVTSTPIFDISNLGMTGDAGIEMDGGLLRISKLNDVTPELTGINTPYLLTDGTIEWYGSLSSQNQLIKGTYGASSTTVSYHDMEVNAAAANTDDFNVGLAAGIELTGVANINSPAVFQMDPSDHIDGTGTFNVLAGSTYKYGDEFGITLGTSTAISAGALRMSTARVAGNFSTDASYGFVGNGDMVSGDALPSQMLNMYVDKTTAGDKVSLTNDAEITNTLDFLTQGIIKTDANLLFVSNDATTAIIDGNTSGTDNYVEGRLQWTTDGTSLYTFPIGHADEDAQGFTIDVNGTSGSEILGFLETNTSSPILSYAYCDLETPNGGTGQIGSGIGTPDGILDQIEFNIASPLQWDVTNPGGGISSYDIVVLANGGQDISPVVSSNASTPIRYLMKNGEPGNTGFATTNGAPAFNANGFDACPNQYTLSGMTSFSDFTLDGAEALNTTLPVELIFFEAKGVNNSEVICSWATATEINNDYFTVERSKDGESFEEVGELVGAGNSSSNLDYEFFDRKAYSGLSYYRLKQTDFDGTFTYSNIVAVNLGGFSLENLEVYPIPFDDKLSIITNSEEQVILSLFDISGKLVRNETIKYSVNLDLSTLSSGPYFLKLTSETINSFQKIIKK